MEVEPRPSVFRAQDELSAGVVADVDGGGDGLVEDVVRFVDLEAHGYLGAAATAMTVSSVRSHDAAGRGGLEAGSGVWCFMDRLVFTPDLGGRQPRYGRGVPFFLWPMPLVPQVMPAGQRVGRGGWAGLSP